MVQETGETRDAIMEDDNRTLEAIIAANKHRTDKYWIVLFAKASKTHVEGKPTLMKFIKAYANKHPSMVGMVCGEVDNSDGSIKWVVNMPQAPFDYNKLIQLGAETSDEVVTETTTIPGAYITQ